MAIPFTQFMMPDGRRVPVSIERPPDVEVLAKQLIAWGYRFEIEMLSTGEISMEILRNGNGKPLAGALVPNGPGVPVAIDQMVREAMVKERE